MADVGKCHRIPLAAKDQKLEAGDRPGLAPSKYLKPAKESPLAAEGAGNDLPTYVGAVPQEGVAAWNWQKTWMSRVKK